MHHYNGDGGEVITFLNNVSWKLCKTGLSNIWMAELSETSMSHLTLYCTEPSKHYLTPSSIGTSKYYLTLSCSCAVFYIICNNFSLVAVSNSERCTSILNDNIVLDSNRHVILRKYYIKLMCWFMVQDEA